MLFEQMKTKFLEGIETCTTLRTFQRNASRQARTIRDLGNGVRRNISYTKFGILAELSLEPSVVIPYFQAPLIKGSTDIGGVGRAVGKPYQVTNNKIGPTLMI